MYCLFVLMLISGTMSPVALGLQMDASVLNLQAMVQLCALART